MTHSEDDLSRIIDRLYEAAEAHECENPCHLCLDLLVHTIDLVRELYKEINGHRSSNGR